MDELAPTQLAFGTVAAVSVAAAYWWGQSGGKKVAGDGTTRISQLETDLAEAKASATKLQTQLDELQAKLKQATAAKESTETKLATALKQNEKAYQELIGKDNKNSDLEEKLAAEAAKTAKELADAKKAVEDAQAKLEPALAQVRSLETEVATLRQNLEAAEGLRTDLASRQTASAEELAKKDSDIVSLQTQLSETKEKVCAFESEKQGLDASLRNSKAEVEALTATVASVEAASTAVETKYLSLKQELEAARSENSTASERALRDADAAASEVPIC
ncbi:hypothetical protein M407DRAFT_26251 [Tulasnella calospora MUT 4182]|uniref:Uncharacterized protein n=1 Tax=Tulasnella calospora MUT 4182 TaxID=1051891 RepID=A0A0C3QG35_9AGAM|nr:hypothetical protein M407DRAFT_26251 [Tulasnella calospora MUT 4182]